MKNFTSRITAWFFLFIFLLHANYLQADAWYKVRSKCRFYRNKYKTQALVDRSAPGVLNTNYSCKNRDGGCTIARSDCYWRDQTRTRAYAHAAEQIVRIPELYDDSGISLKARFFNDAIRVLSCVGSGVIQIPANSGDCHGNSYAGFNRIELPADKTVYHITRPFISEPVQTSRAYTYLADQEPIFNEDNHTIEIRDMKGMLTMNAQDIANDFSAFTISVTYEPQSYAESEDPYDEENQYMENLIWSSTAMLNNGRVVMTGALSNASFQVVKNDGSQSEIAVAVNIDELIIPIPADIDLDDVSINFGVDVGNLGYGISEKFAVDQPTDELTINPFFIPEEVFTFENYPNAVSDVLNVKVKLPTSQDATIYLIDINGEPVKYLYEGGIGANREVIFKEDVKKIGLKDGVYFLRMVLRDRALVRKVIIKH